MRYFKHRSTGEVMRVEGETWHPTDPNWEEVEFVPKHKQRFIRYVNFYADGFVYSAHESRARADECAGKEYERLGCQRVELVEGTWDD